MSRESETRKLPYARGKRGKRASRTSRLKRPHRAFIPKPKARGAAKARALRLIEGVFNLLFHLALNGP
jgi:hypothetical protein